MNKESIVLAVFVATTAILGCKNCDSNQATNKMLALGRVQARMMADGGEGMTNFAAAMTVETAPISELIAQGKFDDACKAADAIAAKYKIDLAKEQQGMITVEQLTLDGGKGNGSCSVADAAKQQMELHSKIQAAVTAGTKTSDLFSKFNEDTKGVAEMLVTDPSKACTLFESLEKKYGL